MREATTKPRNGKATRSKRGTGRLYKRSSDGKEYPAGDPHSGNYYLEYRIDGKRTRQRLTHPGTGEPITDQADAEKERARIIAPFTTSDKAEQLQAIIAKLEAAEREHTQAVEEANPPLSIAEAWDAYENSSERPDSGEETLRRYKGYWNKFRKWAQERNPSAHQMRDITPRDGQSYATHLTKAKVSPNTFNKHTGFLRLFFQTLEEPARMTANPFGKIKRKKLKTEARRELSLEELQTILDAASGELKTLLYIGTFTGLRLGDCSTLKWGEVDLVRGIIKRVPSKTKGSQHKPVTIGIPVALHNILSETPRSNRQGYVVPTFAAQYNYTNNEGKHVRQSLITDQVQAHFRRQGINTHKEGTGSQIKPDPEKPDQYTEEKTGKRAVVEVGFHSLRHTYVSLQAEAGTPQAVVQAIVGHGNPSMTAHYTHIGEAAAKQAALAMPSNILDAEFEILPDPLPPWAKELAEKLNGDNWEEIKAGLLANS
jgi:integrase